MNINTRMGEMVIKKEMGVTSTLFARHNNNNDRQVVPVAGGSAGAGAVWFETIDLAYEMS